MQDIASIAALVNLGRLATRRIDNEDLLIRLRFDDGVYFSSSSPSSVAAMLLLLSLLFKFRHNAMMPSSPIPTKKLYESVEILFFIGTNFGGFPDNTARRRLMPVFNVFYVRATYLFQNTPKHPLLPIHDSVLTTIPRLNSL